MLNKIDKLSVIGYKEWCCGKSMLGGYLCGEHYGKHKFVICDSCLCGMSRRQSKIRELKDNKLLTMSDRHKKIKHIELGIVKV